MCNDAQFLVYLTGNGNLQGEQKCTYVTIYINNYDKWNKNAIGDNKELEQRERGMKDGQEKQREGNPQVPLIS